jgi:hypothetical protein
MITSNYHSQINEMIKRNHKYLSDALFNMFDEELKSWINILFIVFWTNRFIVKFIIDLISFYLQCENESMLSTELKISIKYSLENALQITKRAVLHRLSRTRQEIFRSLMFNVANWFKVALNLYKNELLEENLI